MKNRMLWLLFALLITLGGCAISSHTRQSVYPDMYTEKPVSILVLPPINNSGAADAKEYFACSLAEALALSGYYPLPVEAVFTILRDEGMYDTETITPVVLENLKKHFGADAVLYSTINKWDKKWFLIEGTLTVESSLALVSTLTMETIWDYETTIEISLESSSDNLLFAVLESAVKTMSEDYFPNTRKANIKTMQQALPYGKYHPEHGLDAEKPASASKKGVITVSK